MKRLGAIGAALAVAYVGIVYSGNFVNREAAAAAPETPTGVERLYVLDCGVGHAADKALNRFVRMEGLGERRRLA